MKAMILAAGRGERMRPLTDDTPKPLLEVGGRPLIGYLIEALVAVGVDHLIINVSWHGSQIIDTLGDGRNYGACIEYSEEGRTALETGGGIFKALPKLGSPFIVANGDLYTEYPYSRLVNQNPELAHLVMVRNPPHHPDGDFTLQAGRVLEGATSRLTYSGIGVYTGEMFDGCRPGRFPLAPLLIRAMRQGYVSGELYEGPWVDVGDPARLAALNAALDR